MRIDLAFWKECRRKTEVSDFMAFSSFLLELPEYRSLFLYRIRRNSLIITRKLFKIFFPPLETLYIDTEDIGAGFFIQHGMSTGIDAEKIGERCWVNHNVTIGFNLGAKGAPIIGNGVRITAGAVVLGPVTLKDNCIVGANAVVTKDVEEDAIVGGVPAKVIGKNEEFKLYPEATNL